MALAAELTALSILRAAVNLATVSPKPDDLDVFILINRVYFSLGRVALWGGTPDLHAHS